MYRRLIHITKCFIFIHTFIFASSFANAQLTPPQKKRIDAAIPKKATVKPKQPRKILIWNTPFMDKCPHKGYSVPQAAYAMKTMGQKTGAYEAIISDDIALYLPENLKQFDVIIMNNSNGDWIRPTAADLPKFRKHGSDIDELEKLLKQSLLNWVSNGGGIVAYHHAIGGNNKWPEFKQLLGAGYWGHPWNEEVAVKLDEHDHPLLQAFNGRGFRITEEVFQYREPWSRKTNRVLLSLDTNSTNMTVKWIHRTDNDFGLAWVRSHGKGRIFYSAFGHRTEIWYNPLILQFYLDGIQFTAGDLEADTTPTALLPNKINVEAGFVSLFNGKDLRGWTGNPRIWSVENGIITARTTAANRIAENCFLIWTGGNVTDFELRFQYRLENGNSGVYFRSVERKHMDLDPLIGPQADFSADHRWTGVIMEYLRRGILANRGQKVEIDTNGKISVVGRLGEAKELLKHIKDKDWNDYTVIANGGHVILKINEVVMCELQDNDPQRVPTGKLALQIHRGPEMTVQFKNIRLRQF